MHQAVDFAVFGATPLAMLLAAALARTHKRRVVLVADPPSPFRLARTVDLSVGPLTRPESWALLARSARETARLVNRIAGRKALTRFDPVFMAARAEGIEALSHIRHIAAASGQPVDRLPERLAPEPGGVCYRLRDATGIDQAAFTLGTLAWMEKEGIARLSPRDLRMDLPGGGGARLVAEGSSFAAERVVFADDEAILSAFPAERLAPDLRVVARTTVLTEPAHALLAPLLLMLDRGLLLQQGPSRGLTALASGPPDLAVPRIGAALAGKGVLRRAGQVRFDGLETPDGGGLVGSLAPDMPVLVAGLGMTGAFLAPALARVLAGAASPDEADYFAARGPMASGRRNAAELSIDGLAA